MKNEFKKYFSYLFIILQFLLYYLIFVRNNVIKFDTFSLQLICLITVVNSYYFLKLSDKIKNSIYFSKWYYTVLYVFLNLLISFFISGKQLFMSSPSVAIVIPLHSIFIFLCINVYVFPFIYNCLNLFEKFKLNLENKNRTKKQKILVWISIFLIITVIWTIVSSGYYPGNMTSDSVDQWSQAIGYRQIYSSHPPFLAIIMRLLSYIWKSPFVVILFDICFFASIFASIMTYLYKRGFKIKYIFILTLIFALSINNISLVGIVWKDIPFTAAFMWLIFELFKIYDQKETYFKNIYNIISIIFSMIFVNLLRANGLIQLLTIIAILIVLLFKYKEKIVKINIIIIIVFTFVINSFITHTIFDLFDVQKSSNASSPSTYMFMARALGAVAHYTDDISEDSKKTMIKLMPIQTLKKNYNAYNGDTYGFGEESWKDTLPTIKPNEMYSTYFRECIQHPNIIIRDRLDSNNLLWSMVTPIDGFNSTYIIGIWFPSSISPDVLNLEYTDKEQMVYSNGDNIIKSGFSKYRNYLETNTILYIIFWRPAFSLSVILILCLYLIVKKSKLLVVTLPTIMGILFWVLFMIHQSYRYLWFVYVSLILLLIFHIYENSKNR